MTVTKDSLAQKFHDWAEQAARDASYYIDEPMFQSFMAMSGDDLHDFFAPLGYSAEFPQNMELYRHLRYCVLDDGELSFVRAKFSVRQPEVAKPRVVTSFFAMHGDFRELGVHTVLGAASPYHSGHKELISYRSIRFQPELLDVINDRRKWLNTAAPLPLPGTLPLEEYRAALAEIKRHSAYADLFLTNYIAGVMRSTHHSKMAPLGMSFHFRAKARDEQTNP